MKTVQLACDAMATRFEFIMNGTDERALRAAGEEAFEEILRLEQELGFYRANSEISRLNTEASKRPVRVSPLLFGLLEQSLQLSGRTNGAFDITVAPLMRCWGLAGGEGRFPDDDELKRAMTLIGPQNIHLDRANYTVRFWNDGVQVDLGSIGKGFALDIVAEWLRDAGVTSALIHGGTSTTYAIGTPPDQDSWKVAIVRPEDGPILSKSGAAPVSGNILATVDLCDSSMSVSAIWGKSFELDGQTYGHVIDPRSGQPVSGAYLAAVVASSATETDALATALLTLGNDGQDLLAKEFHQLQTLVAAPDEFSSYRVEGRGITPS